MGLSKKKCRICQFSTGFHPGDAISQEMISLDHYFRAEGYRSELYAAHIDMSVRSISQKFSRYSPESDDILIYHHSIHSDVFDFVIQKNVKKILIYHNVTPAHFFEPYDLQFSYSLSQGKKELVDVRNEFTHSFADSDFNLQELLGMGYENVGILPICYDFKNLDLPHVVRQKFNGIKILFVGRISPNKRQDDLIRFAEIYRKYFRTDFKIQIVGYSSPASKRFMDELQSLVRFYELEDFIHFSGYVTQSELNGYYREADLFLSMSEHEGFCVPIMEAMHFQIPILAYEAGAVSETMGGGGILFREKNYPYIAELVEEVLQNQNLRNSIRRRQVARLAEYRSVNPEKIIGSYIQTIAN